MGYIGAICWDNGKENGDYYNGLRRKEKMLETASCDGDA